MQSTQTPDSVITPVIALTPLRRHVRGNIVLTLQGVTSPIHLTFENNAKIFDEPLTIKIRDIVKGALPLQNIVSSGGHNRAKILRENSNYSRFLEGIIPDAARSVDVIASFDALAWIIDNKLVVKTEAELLHPGYSYREARGEIKLFVLDPLETLEFTIAGDEQLLMVEY